MFRFLLFMKGYYSILVSGYGAERFIYNFTFYDFFGDAPEHARDKCFVAVKPLMGE